MGSMMMLALSKQRGSFTKCVSAFATPLFSSSKVRTKTTWKPTFISLASGTRGGGGGESVDWGSATRNSRYSTTTSLRAGEDANDIRKEMLDLTVQTICNEDRRKKCNFGGLVYQNTDIDNRFRVLFVLGGPGAGKGTQSALMEEHYPTAHFSVGQLLRDEQEKEDSPHKAIIEQRLVEGKIVPVEISLALLQNAMEHMKEKSVLVLVDGFPRNYDNLQGWCRNMDSTTAMQAVLMYQCPLEVLEERVMQRAVDSGRSDDTREAVKKRFHTFEQQTVPVVDVMRDAATDACSWSVIDIQGDQSLENVWLCTQQVLNQFILDDVLTANAALLEAIETKNLEKYQQLCDASWFRENDAKAVMEQHEGPIVPDQKIDVQNAQVDVISGKHVAVSYDRVIEGGIMVREKRIWSHHGKYGWQTVHFVRTPHQQQQQLQDDAKRQAESTTA